MIQIPFPTSGHEKIVELLLKKGGADPNQRFGNGATVLHTAAMRGSDDIVKFLIKNGADVNVQDDSGRAPLYWAVLKSNKCAFFYFLLQFLFFLF